MNKQKKNEARNSLTERYVYAVTVQIPYKMRADVADELRSLISDMLEERYQGMTIDERHIKSVLTELGEPAELAQKYRGDGEYSCLIGGDCYPQYMFLIKLLLASIVFALTIAHLVIGVLESGGAGGDGAVYWGRIALQWITVTLQAGCGVFTFITLLFAILYRKGISVNVGLPSGTIDNLPPVPAYNIKGDAACNLILCVLFCIVFLVLPSVFTYRTDGQAVPIFNTPFLRASWLFILFYTALCIAREILSVTEGTYTYRLLWISLALNLASAGTAFCWLRKDSLLSPAFVEFAAADTAFGGMLGSSGYYFLALLFLALILDSGKRIIRTRQEDQNRNSARRP